MTTPDLAFQFAKEVSTQLITIASALIGVSVTFIKDFTPSGKTWLRASWLLYILSILFGVVTLMALTGTIESLAASGKPFQHFSTSTRWPAATQIISFVIATICLVIFGWQHNLQRTITPKVPTSDETAPVTTGKPAIKEEPTSNITKS